MTYCLDDLIGVKFKYGGRGPETFDCWGLVQECHRRWHGVELPDYRSTASPERNAALMASEGQKLWQQLPGIEPGSILLIRVKRYGAHVGFAHSRTRFLQALEGFGVIESRAARFERQILGAYRYVGQHPA